MDGLVVLSRHIRSTIRHRKRHYTVTNQIMQLDTLDVSLPRGVLVLLF